MTIATIIDAIIARNDTRISQAGNQLYEASYHRDRYVVDFAEDFTSGGWQQFDTDQDAWYFGVWVNPRTFQTLSYAEGDWHLVQCDGPAAYNREIQSMIDYYGEGFIAKAFDMEDDGRETIYRQDRSSFLIPTGTEEN